MMSIILWDDLNGWLEDNITHSYIALTLPHVQYLTLAHKVVLLAAQKLFLN